MDGRPVGSALPSAFSSFATCFEVLTVHLHLHQLSNRQGRLLPACADFTQPGSESGQIVTEMDACWVLR